MQGNLKLWLHKINPKYLNNIIKFIIVCLSFAYIYKQLFAEGKLSQLLKHFNQLQSDKILPFIIISIFLMIANWLIEAFKWRYLIHKLEKISVIKAILAVLAGVSVSIFTPNRVGEYGGRIFVLKKNENRIKAILITMLGSFSQQLITIIIAAIFIPIFIKNHIDNSSNTFIYTSLSSAIITITLIISFFNIEKLNIIFKRFPKLIKYTAIFNQYSNKELFLTLTLSLIRYAVFILQYHLVIMFFGLEIPFSQSLMMISIMFFIMSVIPNITLFEIGVKGSLTLWIFNYGIENISQTEKAAIVFTTIFIWIVNLALPAILGWIALMRFNFVNSNKLKQ